MRPSRALKFSLDAPIPQCRQRPNALPRRDAARHIRRLWSTAAGLRAVIRILFLNSYGRRIPKRLVIDIGLVAMGITLVALALIRPIASAVGAAYLPRVCMRPAKRWA